MKTMIMGKIEELGGNVSFVDLMALPGFAGDQHFGLPKKNLVYWMNVSNTFVRAVHELVRDGVVVFDLTTPLTYLIDGCTLNIPIFDGDFEDDSSSWLPLVINKGPSFYHNKEDQVA